MHHQYVKQLKAEFNFRMIPFSVAILVQVTGDLKLLYWATPSTGQSKHHMTEAIS